MITAAALTTDFVTVLAGIAALNPVVMGVCNEPVCYFCGLTQHPKATVQHEDTCLWRRANMLVEAVRGAEPGGEG